MIRVASRHLRCGSTSLFTGIKRAGSRKKLHNYLSTDSARSRLSRQNFLHLLIIAKLSKLICSTVLRRFIWKLACELRHIGVSVISNLPYGGKPKNFTCWQ